jgi:transposase-like protein
MAEISYRRHRFPPVIIQHAIWVYLRFTLSYRDVEELLAERGLDISYETVRCWVLKFGPVIARRLRRCRPRPSKCWHLGEMVMRIGGKRYRERINEVWYNYVKGLNPAADFGIFVRLDTVWLDKT